jgi:hypothetical protein
MSASDPFGRFRDIIPAAIATLLGLLFLLAINALSQLWRRGGF